MSPGDAAEVAAVRSDGRRRAVSRRTAARRRRQSGLPSAGVAYAAVSGQSPSRRGAGPAVRLAGSATGHSHPPVHRLSAEAAVPRLPGAEPTRAMRPLLAGLRTRLLRPVTERAVRLPVLRQS